jgi:hypothetical protein
MSSYPPLCSRIYEFASEMRSARYCRRSGPGLYISPPVCVCATWRIRGGCGLREQYQSVCVRVRLLLQTRPDGWPIWK